MRSTTILLVIGVALAACNESGEGKSQSEGTARGAVRALCSARDNLSESVDSSRRTFQDEAHAALHELVRRVTPKDRAAAARLLEAKQRLEVAYDVNTEPSTLSGFLVRLIVSANAALEDLGLRAVQCS